MPTRPISELIGTQIAAAAHGHVVADVSGLQTALDGKQPVGSYADAVHAHAEYQPVGSYATADHLHTGVYAAAGHDHNADYQPLDTQLTSLAGLSYLGNGLKVVRVNLAADGFELVSPSGGSDPWTYAVLANDFTTSSATAVDTGLSFTPSANTKYEFEAVLMLRTATATVGPRPGIGWATGGSDGVCDIYTTSAAATEVQQHGNITASVLGPVGGLPTTTGSWPARITGLFIAGASPTGSVRVQLASETAGTVVTLKAGSILKYRTY